MNTFNPCITGGMDGEVFFSLPQLDGEFTLMMEINSSGGNNNDVIEFASGLTVILIDGFSIDLSLNSFFARFIISQPLNQYNQLVVVRTGFFLRDWKVYLNGAEAVFTTVGNVDGDTTTLNIFPSVVTLPQFNGVKRNFFVRQGVSDGFAHGTPYDDFGFTLQTPNEIGLKGIPTNGTPTFVQDAVVKRPRNQFAFEINKPIRIPTDFPISGFCGCNDNPLFSKTITVHQGIIKFKLTETSGKVKINNVCSSGYSDAEVAFSFTNQSDLVSQFAVTGWNLTYGVGEYTLTYTGGGAPDFGTPCEDVPHIPFLYSSRPNSSTPKPPKNVDDLLCGTSNTCYLYIGFEQTCVEITRQFGCINDEVTEITFPEAGEYTLGTNGFILNGVWRFACKDVIHLRWFNDNQIARNLSILGRISDRQYKNVSEVSTSTRGVVRKLYNQNFNKYVVYTDFYTYDVVDMFSELIHSDHFQILINGKWREFTVEDGLDVEDEPANLPTRAKMTFTVTEKEFIITNDFI